MYDHDVVAAGTMVIDTSNLQQQQQHQHQQQKEKRKTPPSSPPHRVTSLSQRPIFTTSAFFLNKMTSMEISPPPLVAASASASLVPPSSRRNSLTCSTQSSSCESTTATSAATTSIPTAMIVECNNLGVQEYKRGNHEAALQHFRRAVQSFAVASSSDDDDDHHHHHHHDAHYQEKDEEAACRSSNNNSHSPARTTSPRVSLRPRLWNLFPSPQQQQQQDAHDNNEMQRNDKACDDDDDDDDDDKTLFSPVGGAGFDSILHSVKAAVKAVEHYHTLQHQEFTLTTTPTTTRPTQRKTSPWNLRRRGVVVRSLPRPRRLRFPLTSSCMSTPPPSPASPKRSITTTKEEEREEDHADSSCSDYDEGMDSYSQTLLLEEEEEEEEDEDNNDVQQLLHNFLTIVIYNLGRVFQDLYEHHDWALEFYQQVHQRLGGGGGVEENAQRRQVRFYLYNSMGQVYYHQGQYSKARFIFTKIFQTECICLQGAQAAHVWNALGVLQYHMASDFRAVKDDDNDSGNGGGGYAKALQFLLQSLELQQQVALVATNNNSVSLATTLNNLGRVYFIQCRYQKAMTVYQQALEIRRTQLGPNHLDVAATLFNLGQAHHQEGDYAQAMSLYQEYSRIVQHKLSCSCSSASASASTSCSSNNAPNDKAKAAQQRQRHWRDVAIVTTCLGQVHHEQRSYQEAQACYEKALDLSCQALGGDCHAEVALTLNKLGNLHYERGDLSRALELYRRGLRVELAVLEPCNPNIVVTLNNMAEIYKQRKEYPKALETYRRVLSHQQQQQQQEQSFHHQGTNTLTNTSKMLELAQTLSNIGFVLHQTGDYAGALEVYQECLSLRRDVRSRDNQNDKDDDDDEEDEEHDKDDRDKLDLDIANTLTQMAVLLLKSKDSSSFSPRQDWALALLQESYCLRRDLTNDEGRDFAFTLYNMAVIYHYQGMYEHALLYYHETAKVERRVLGDSHSDLAITYSNMAQVYYQWGHLESAQVWFQRALDLLLQQQQLASDKEACSGASQVQHLARTWTELGNVELQLGNLNAFMEAFSQATRLYRQAGIAHPEQQHVVVYGQRLYQFQARHAPSAAAA